MRIEQHVIAPPLPVDDLPPRNSQVAQALLDVFAVVVAVTLICATAAAVTAALFILLFVHV